MNKRDEMNKEKSIYRGHSRGKSINIVNISSLNKFRESGKQNDGVNYTKINPTALKSSKMTPDESFRLRAHNSSEKADNIILSRSNSDYPFTDKSHSNLTVNNNNYHMNHATKSILNGNYTNYNGFSHESKMVNQNSLSNSNKHNSTNGINNKIYRSPIDPRKSNKVSPIKSVINGNEKSSSGQEKQIFTNTFNGSSNIYSNKNTYDSKNKIYGNKIGNGNLNSRQNNFLVITNANDMNKSVNGSYNTHNSNIMNGNIKSYLPNVNYKSLNGKEKGYSIFEKKENDYHSVNPYSRQINSSNFSEISTQIQNNHNHFNQANNLRFIAKNQNSNRNQNNLNINSTQNLNKNFKITNSGISTNQIYDRLVENYDNNLNNDKKISSSTNGSHVSSNISNFGQTVKKKIENYAKIESNSKENRDFTPNISVKRTLHERKRSFDSKKALSFIDSIATNVSSNNCFNSNLNGESGGLRNIFKKFAAKSKAGRTYDGNVKTNQDSYLMKNNIFGFYNFSMFGVFDGHGSHGHFISNMIKMFFSEYFSKSGVYLNSNPPHTLSKSSINANFKSNNGLNKTNFNSANNTGGYIGWKDITAPIPNGNAQMREDIIYERMKESNYSFLKNSFSIAESSISMSKYEVNFSGSTCVLLFIIENKIICANTGDSRALMVSQLAGNDVIIPLSRDHKPDLKDEMYRITRSNGRVDKFNDNGIKTGPYRVWLKNQNYPGLAMSRSIGDLVAGSVGVICEPEIIEHEINEKSKFIIMASDGIWEFLSNERVADIVNPFYYSNMDANGAAEKLVEEATRCWRREDESVDDITVVVIFLHVKN